MTAANAEMCPASLLTLPIARSSLRMGIWGDWEEPYLTLDPRYEAAQLEVFGTMFLNGHIYRGRKPVHWSPSSQTALAESVRVLKNGVLLLRPLVITMVITTGMVISTGQDWPIDLQPVLKTTNSSVSSSSNIYNLSKNILVIKIKKLMTLLIFLTRMLNVLCKDTVPDHRYLHTHAQHRTVPDPPVCRSAAGSSLLPRSWSRISRMAEQMAG